MIVAPPELIISLRKTFEANEPSEMPLFLQWALLDSLQRSICKEEVMTRRDLDRFKRHNAVRVDSALAELATQGAIRIRDTERPALTMLPGGDLTIQRMLEQAYMAIEKPASQ